MCVYIIIHIHKYCGVAGGIQGRVALSNTHVAQIAERASPMHFVK